MTIKFLIVTNSMPQDALMPIYVRLINSKYYDKKVKTKLIINQRLWDPKREMIKLRVLCNDKFRKHVNDEISNIRSYIFKMFEKEENPENLPSSWLSDCLNNYYNKISCSSKSKKLSSKEMKLLQKLHLTFLNCTRNFRTGKIFQIHVQGNIKYL